MDQCYNLIPGGAGGRPSNGQGGARRVLSYANGLFIEGQISAISGHCGISDKKVSDVVHGRHPVYRGFRAM